MTQKQNMAATSFVSATELPRLLLRDIRAARRRIVLMAMNFDADSATTPLLEAAAEAAKRGVEVTILPDNYARVYPANVWLYSARTSSRHTAEHAAARLRVMQKKLEAAGARVRFLHQPTGGWRRLIPIARRNHSKVYLVDDTAYCFGGTNFSKLSFEHHDYMLRITHHEQAVEWLYKTCMELYKKGRLSKPDFTKKLPSLGLAIFDTGRPSRSRIYDEAVALVRSADAKLIYVSQHRPGGAMKRALIDAQSRLSDELVVFNHYSKFRLIGRLQQYIESLSGRLHEKQPTRGYVHAKYIIATYKDGRRVALSGSHNFHAGGVWLGTAELALKTESPEIIAWLESFTDSIPLT